MISTFKDWVLGLCLAFDLPQTSTERAKHVRFDLRALSLTSHTLFLDYTITTKSITKKNLYIISVLA